MTDEPIGFNPARTLYDEFIAREFTTMSFDEWMEENKTRLFVQYDTPAGPTVHMFANTGVQQRYEAARARDDFRNYLFEIGFCTHCEAWIDDDNEGYAGLCKRCEAAGVKP